MIIILDVSVPSIGGFADPVGVRRVEIRTVSVQHALVVAVIIHYEHVSVGNVRFHSGTRLNAPMDIARRCHVGIEV